MTAKTTKVTNAPDAETKEETYSAKDLAAEAGTDPKSFRRWLRSVTTDRANKGGRWVFTAEAKAALLEQYRNRNAAKATTAATPAEG